MYIFRLGARLRFFFFFSSRRRHTRSLRDWSSDVCSSDLAPGNPLFGSSDPNERRIIGYGFRNPFRMIVKPGTNDVWVADVGSGTWEEIDRIPDITSARNYG